MTAFYSQKYVITSVICLFVIQVAEGTLSKSKRGKKAKEEKILEVADSNVVDRGLVTKKPRIKDIIKEHSQYFDRDREMKNFEGEILAYVTPWNNHGYDIAKLFKSKFQYVSPVWLQVKVSPGGVYYVQGTHDIDKGWVKDVTKGGKSKMVPRLLFDGWNAQDFMNLFKSEDNIEDCIAVILKTVKEYKFPGLVVEMWPQLVGKMRKELTHVINHMGDAFHAVKKQLIVVIPPPLYDKQFEGMISREDVEAMSPHVDRFSLMTYDFSNPSRPGPNAPIGWVRSCIEALAPNKGDPIRKKLLVGLNFYGFKYSTKGNGGPVLGNEYIEILKAKSKPQIHWHEESAEHYIEFKSGDIMHKMWFPSLNSIAARLKLATDMGVGLSIWEIGQGLDYFYDLL